MKNVSAMSSYCVMMMLSFIVLFCRTADANDMTWVQMDEHGFITVDQLTITMMFGAAAQDISAGPLKVLVNESAPYSTVTQDLDLMKLTFLAAYGISHDKKNTGRYLVPCVNVPKLPDMKFTIGEKVFVMPPSQYTIQNDDEDVAPGTCITIYANTKKEHPEDIPVLVWGIPHVQYFKIQVDKVNKRVGLAQP